MYNIYIYIYIYLQYIYVSDIVLLDLWLLSELTGITGQIGVVGARREEFPVGVEPGRPKIDMARLKIRNIYRKAW